MPKIQATIVASNHQVSTYNPASPVESVHEAILVCMDRQHAMHYPFGIVRADVQGAQWQAAVKAGAVDAIFKELSKAADAVITGSEPRIYVDVQDGQIKSGRLAFTQEQFAAEDAAASTPRYMTVPRVLPYQMGGDENGTFMVMYRPQNEKRVQVHSLHPTHAEATIASNDLKSRIDAAIVVMQVETSVSRILKAACAGAYIKADDSDGLVAGNVTSTPAAVKRSVVPTPSPFA